MQDFKLKLILTLLAGIVFSFVFILLAFATPLKKNEPQVYNKPKGKLEQVSEAVRNR